MKTSFFSRNLIPICLKSNYTCKCVQSLNFQEISSMNEIQETETKTPTATTRTTSVKKMSGKTLVQASQELPYREGVQFINLEDGTPEKTVPRTAPICVHDGDCKEDEYCDGVCEKKVGVGGICRSNQGCVGSYVATEFQASSGGCILNYF